MEASVHRWDDLLTDNPIPLISRKRVVGTHVMVSMVNLAKGCHVATHSHENEQFAYVVSGRTLFGLGAEGSPERREVVVSGGEVLVLPPNVPHSADALEDTLILDIFSPVSEGTGIDEQGRGH